MTNENIKLKIEDSDFGMGGIDRFNSETGKSEIIPTGLAVAIPKQFEIQGCM